MNAPNLHPPDKHNQELLRHTHPVDWENPAPRKKYNLVAIGGGSAGIISALGTAGLGGHSALVERHLLGGDCLNYGCVPSKALLHAAKVAHTVRTASESGVHVHGTVDIRFAEIMDRMRAVRASIAPHDSARRFTDLGTDVFLGEARFTGPDTLDVAGQELRFARCVIATGGRAAVPHIPGLKETGFLTNETLFSLTSRPNRLAVLGMGPIGSEMAQAFRRFGCEVHGIDKASHPLSREDAEIGQRLAEQFRREGIQLHLHSIITRVERTETGKRVHIETSGQPHAIDVDEILVSLGRQPNVEGLNLEAAGVRSNAQGIVVDDRLQSSNPKIFAAGDVAGHYQFTHAADAMARICVQNALFLGRKKLSGLVMPWCTYTDPEVAHVGLSLRTAREQGIAIDTYRAEMKENDRAVTEGATAGLAMIHTAEGTGKVLGATIVGPRAGDILSELTLLMTAGKPLDTLAETIHCYPTQAEILRTLANQYRRTRLTPLVRSLFARWLAWQRQ